MVKDLKEVLLDDFWIMPATPKYINKGVPYITSKNIKNEKIDFSNVNYINIEDYERISKNRPILIDDILISMIGTLGEVAVVKKSDGVFYGQNMFLVRLNKDKIYQRYFINFFKSNIVKRQLMRKQNKSTQSYLKANHIESLKIPIPDIAEQKKIANKLDKIQEIINIRKKQIEQLDELIKSQFVEMFKSEKNIEKLENVCQFINGDRGKNYPSASEFVDKGIPFINAGLIKEKKVDWNNMNYITENKYNKLGSGKIQKDDILYCLRGSLGKHCIIDTDKRGAIASSLVILRPKREKIEPIFLLIQLGMDEIIKQQNQANNGSSQPNLSASSVKKYKIKLPDMVLQTKFVNIVKQINKQEFEIQKSIEETQNLQKSLMDKCFGG